MNLESATQKVKEYIVDIIKTDLKQASDIAILFSGSLDSSLIAFLVKEHSKAKVKLYTIGFPNCYDFKQSREAADLLGLEVKYIRLDDSTIKVSLREYLNLIQDKDKVSISYTLPFYILLKHIKEKTAVTGHGADTLFGGFYKYLESKDLKQEIKKCYKNFLDMLPQREFKIAKHFNKVLILPFANKKLADFVLSLPEYYFIKNKTRKYLLRKVAREVNLPYKLVNQPKKAIQYSSGIMKRLRKFWNISLPS